MIHDIVRKQHNSKMCFICGMHNRFGLKARFYETLNNELIACFTPSEEHQSYPGRLHGGIASAILDEAMGRAILAGKDTEIWGVTIDLRMRFKKPIPLHEEIKVLCRITDENSKFFEGSGEIVLPNGDIAASATGRYLKVPLEKIADFDRDANEWKVVESEHDPKTIEIMKNE